MYENKKQFQHVLWYGMICMYVPNDLPGVGGLASRVQVLHREDPVVVGRVVKPIKNYRTCLIFFPIQYM